MRPRSWSKNTNDEVKYNLVVIAKVSHLKFTFPKCVLSPKVDFSRETIEKLLHWCALMKRKELDELLLGIWILYQVYQAKNHPHSRLKYPYWTHWSNHWTNVPFGSVHFATKSLLIIIHIFGEISLRSLSRHCSPYYWEQYSGQISSSTT